MKASLAQGMTHTRRFEVDVQRTIDLMGEDRRVYATPKLVHDIEVTCRDFLLQHLDAGEDTVGTRVELDHMAPTLLGMRVDITVTVAELNGRAVSLAIEARDNFDAIAKGLHHRFIVDVEQTRARLKAKSAKATAAA